MTVKEVIEKVGTLRRNNQFTIEDKMRWLNQCEAKVQLECLLMPRVEITYDYAADADEKLIAKPPFDEMYIHYVCAKIDEALGEMEMYNDTVKLYNDVNGDFQRWLIKEYDPAHNKICVRREDPVIVRGQDVSITLYGLVLSAEEITEAKVWMTQGDTTTVIDNSVIDGDTLTFDLTASQTYKLSEGSLFVSCEVSNGTEKYGKTKRIYVSGTADVHAVVSYDR